MLIKSLFNLQTNSPVNLPNEYFLMLEKEQKYKELFQKLQKLNKFNQNIIDSISTIKITLVQLINDFLKPSEGSFMVKIQQTLFTPYSIIKKVCQNLQKTLDSKISNYEKQIQNLSKKYKQQLEQVAHYRKKLQGMKKGGFESREQKQKFTRNIGKQKIIEQQCKKTQKTLLKNYESFSSETLKYLKLVPKQIIIHLIEGNIKTAGNILETIDQQLSLQKHKLRRKSILSSVISQISDIQEDALSQYSESDFKNQDSIHIIIQPESEQFVNDKSQIIQMIKQEQTQDDQNNQKYRNQQIQTKNKNLRRSSLLKKSLMKKSSIQQKLRNKQNIIQRITKILQVQCQMPEFKVETSNLIQKAFQNVKAPTNSKEKLKNVFLSKKNIYSKSNVKINISNQKQKIILNTRNGFHERSFVLQKEEFKNKHSLKKNKNKETLNIQHLKNQQTLNCNSDQEQNGSYQSRKNHQKSISLSSEMSNKHQKSNDSNQLQLKSKVQPKKQYLHSAGYIQNSFQYKTDQKSMNTKKYHQKIKYQPVTQIKHHPTFNYLPPKHLNNNFGSINNLQKPPISPKPMLLIEQKRKKVMQHLFSVPGQIKITNNKITQNNPLELKKIVSINSQKNTQTDLKYWFSTQFSSTKINQNNNNKVIEAKIFRFNQQKQNQPKTPTNIKSFSNNNKIDFSIFQKIV